MGSPGGQNNCTSPYFNNFQVKKNVRTCQGVMICEQTDPELANKCHNNVDFDSDEFRRVKNNECLIDCETNTYM